MYIDGGDDGDRSVATTTIAIPRQMRTKFSVVLLVPTVATTAALPHLS